MLFFLLTYALLGTVLGGLMIAATSCYMGERSGWFAKVHGILPQYGDVLEKAISRELRVNVLLSGPAMAISVLAILLCIASLRGSPMRRQK